MLASAEVRDRHERPGEAECREVLDLALSPGHGLVPGGVHEVEGVEKISWAHGASLMRGPWKSGIMEPENGDAEAEAEEEANGR